MLWIAPITPPMEDIPEITSILDPNAGGLMGGVPGGLVGGVIGAIPNAMPPPPPPPKKKDPIRVGGNVQSSKLIVRVEPKYPELAKRARIQGIVLLPPKNNGTCTGDRYNCGHLFIDCHCKSHCSLVAEPFGPKKGTFLNCFV